MFGINGAEFLVLMVVVLVVVGPERLPQYASQLARLARQARQLASGAREQVRAEMGPEFDDVDWRKLDPRQYDPRRIVRDALRDDAPAPTGPGARPQRQPHARADPDRAPAPFDPDAT